MSSRPGRVAAADKENTEVVAPNVLKDVTSRSNKPTGSAAKVGKCLPWPNVSFALYCPDEIAQAAEATTETLGSALTQDEPVPKVVHAPRSDARRERQSEDDDDDDDNVLIALAKKRKEERSALRDLRRIRDELAAKLAASDQSRQDEAAEHARKCDAANAESERIRAENEQLRKGAEQAQQEAAAKQEELRSKVQTARAQESELKEQLRLAWLELDKVRAQEMQALVEVKHKQDTEREAVARASRVQKKLKEAEGALAALKSEQRHEAARSAEQRTRFKRLQAQALYGNALCMAGVEVCCLLI